MTTLWRLASRRDRLLSAAVDALCLLGVSMLLASTLGEWCASRTVTLLHIGQPDTFWRGPVPLVLGILGNVLYALPVVGWIVLSPEAVAGRGPGKLVLRLCIGAAPAGVSGRPHPGTPSDTSTFSGAAPPRGPLLGRFFLKTAPCGFWLAALLWSAPVFAALFAGSVIVVLLGVVPVLRGGASWHERLSATRVWREARSAGKTREEV